MRKFSISLTTIFLLAAAAALTSRPATSHAQTENQSSKIVVTEAFTFPDECTGELMNVADTTVVTCHDQQRADGTFNEKCEIRQDVTAVGQTTGTRYHGTATFKDEFTATDQCNFQFTNRGRVHLISAGADANLILTFDDTIVMENCVLKTDTHLAGADCRGGRQ